MATAAMGASAAGLAMPTVATEPSDQRTAATVAAASARSCMPVATAPAATVRATPARMRSPARSRLLAAAAVMAVETAAAPAKAATTSPVGEAAAGATTSRLRAPSAAPAVVPMVLGLASGFWSRIWKAAPAAARLPPASAASATRGSRSEVRMKRALSPSSAGPAHGATAMRPAQQRPKRRSERALTGRPRSSTSAVRRPPARARWSGRVR
jgi:hypothetical protein